jgi:hypothetical protein
MTVLTTSEIPIQMRKCNHPTMLVLLPWISEKLIGQALPLELAEVIWQYASEGTMTREDAERYRLELMNDRKVGMNINTDTTVRTKLSRLSMLRY